jgi:hypothetical protein
MNIFSKIQYKKIYLVYAKIVHVLYVYTLFVSHHVNDGFETGIKSDIEF